jgi:dGTPase
VVDVLEKNGQGLNLTYEVRDGILKHSKGYGRVIPEDPNELAATIEGRIVRIADIIAYLNHDLDDAIRSGVIVAAQVPEVCTRVLGTSHSQRAATMIRDLVFASTVSDAPRALRMSDPVHEAMMILRQFLFENVYRAPLVHNEFVKAKKILTELFTYFLDNPDMLQRQLEDMEMLGCNHREQTRERIVCDLIATMTDRNALELYERIFFPSRLV